MSGKPLLLVIAGPQSSGKSTAFRYLQKIYKKVNFVPEVNPVTIVGNSHFGGAFADRKIQKIIAGITLQKLAEFSRTNNIYISETSIFGAVYYEKICGEKEANDYLEKLINICKKFKIIIIFIDTKPQISWSRRKNIYLKRIKHIKKASEKKKMLDIYKKNLFDLYPIWLKYYHLFPYQKFMIKNNRKSFSKFIKEVETKVAEILTE